MLLLDTCPDSLLHGKLLLRLKDLCFGLQTAAQGSDQLIFGRRLVFHPVLRLPDGQILLRVELMELALKRCDLPVLLSLGQLHRGILLPFQLLIEFPIPDLLLDRGIAVFVDRKHLAALGAFDLLHVDISLSADSSGSRCVFLDADEIQDLRRSHSLLFIRRQACCPISRLNAVIAELRMVAAFDHQFQ